MYAFWTHAIDLSFQYVERKYFNDKDDEVRLQKMLKDAYSGRSDMDIPYDYCSEEDYVDAAHKGLLLQIRSLPHDIRIPVANYLEQRLERSISNMPDDVHPDAFINWLVTENLVEYVKRNHVKSF